MATQTKDIIDPDEYERIRRQFMGIADAVGEAKDAVVETVSAPIEWVAEPLNMNYDLRIFVLGVVLGYALALIARNI